jgi:hypothetical protein
LRFRVSSIVTEVSCTTITWCATLRQVP